MKHNFGTIINNVNNIDNISNINVNKIVNRGQSWKLVETYKNGEKNVKTM